MAILLVLNFLLGRRPKTKIKRLRAVRKTKSDDQMELCIISDVINDVTLHEASAHSETNGKNTVEKQNAPAANALEMADQAIPGKNEALASTDVKAPSLSRSLSSNKSCATVLDNFAYDDMIATIKIGQKCKSRLPFSWASERFFPGGPILAFSRWWLKAFFQGWATVMKFHFTNSKIREKIFSTENLIWKYQISKSRGVKAPCSPFRRPWPWFVF